MQKELSLFTENNTDLTNTLDELADAIPDGDVEDILEEQQERHSNLRLKISELTSTEATLLEEITDLATNPYHCAACDQELPESQVKANATLLKLKYSAIADRRKELGEKQANQYDVAALVGICKEYLITKRKLLDLKDVEALKESITSKKAEKNPFNSVLLAMEEDLADEIVKAQKSVKELQAENIQLEHYTFWNKAFGKDLKTVLFYQVCPYLEDKTNQYLRDLNNGQLKVKFSTEREMRSGDTKDEFCVTASSDTGSSVFELFSGAEQQLTSFAVGMALSDLSSMQTEGASQFMILDEPFLYQSPENCENIVNFITQKLSDKSTILLISNEDNLAGLIPNRIRIVKEKGVSSIA
jgi:DNA repair exonuclease SbcCD ATPase subunit